MMKKIVILTVAAALVLPLAFTPPARAAEDPCAGVNVDWMRKHVPLPPGKIVQKAQESGLCQIIYKVQNEFVAIYAGRDFLLAGEMFRDRKQVTAPVIMKFQKEALADQAAMRKKMMGGFDELVAFTYTPKNANGHTIYMITDPLCPYCNKAGKGVKKLSDKTGATIKTLLFTVHGEKGTQKSIEAICKNYDLDEYNESSWKKAPTPDGALCEAGSDLVGKTAAFVAKLGLRGVPAFVLDDGQMIPGADMAAVERALTAVPGSDTVDVR